MGGNYFFFLFKTLTMRLPHFLYIITKGKHLPLLMKEWPRQMGDALLNQVEVSMLSSECTTRSRSLWCCIAVPWLLSLYGLRESNLIEFFDIAVIFCKLQPTNFISICFVITEVHFVIYYILQCALRWIRYINNEVNYIILKVIHRFQIVILRSN